MGRVDAGSVEGDDECVGDAAAREQHDCVDLSLLCATVTVKKRIKDGLAELKIRGRKI